MMSSADNRYNLLFKQMHKMQMIHHFALLLFKNYLTIQVGTSQRIHRKYIRYESALDDMLIGIENLPETKYIALTDNNYVPLTQAQILLCAKIRYMYYCEYAHLLKKYNDIHACLLFIMTKKVKLK